MQDVYYSLAEIGFVELIYYGVKEVGCEEHPTQRRR